MKYKVCILAAGIAPRMGRLVEYTNKALLPVKFKPVLSYIIEKFPKDIEVVVAVGHQKEAIMDFLSIAYPERKFKFVEVDRYIGPGTGPGYSLLQCKKELQCPFVFFTADTLVIEEIPVPDHNWFGIAPVSPEKTEQYCSVKVKNNLICQIDDKIKTDNPFAFIGLAGVKDHADFFGALEVDKHMVEGEIQVSNGFKKLMEKGMTPVEFSWFDTGTFENYLETNKNFSGEDESFNFSKGEEFLYFVNDRVIKFFADQTIVDNRYERGTKYLKGLCPSLEKKVGHFFCYKRIDGQPLYNVLNIQTVNDFLQWLKAHLWKEAKLDKREKEKFLKTCQNFYKEKTYKRLNMFYEKTHIEDGWSNVNGVSIPPLKELFEQLEWEMICEGIPSNFHGDLQFDNVLVSRDEKSNLPKFVLLDWRQDFAGELAHGDLYYDLAKLYGGVTLSYQLIKKGKFTFDMSGSSVYYNFFIPNDLLEAKEEYEIFLVRNGFNLRKIKLITAIIFLNMSPLHHDPFDRMLYFMGKNLLYKVLTRDGNAPQTRKSPTLSEFFSPTGSVHE